MLERHHPLVLDTDHGEEGPLRHPWEGEQGEGLYLDPWEEEQGEESREENQEEALHLRPWEGEELLHHHHLPLWEEGEGEELHRPHSGEVNRQEIPLILMAEEQEATRPSMEAEQV